MTGRDLVALDRYDVQQAVRRLPRAVRALMEQEGPRVFVAGGFIRAVVAGEKVSDVDLFTGSKETSELFARRLAAETKARLIETDNAFTLVGKGLPVQFIHRWTFEAPAEVVSSFDFTIACASIWFDGTWQSLADARFYGDLAAHRLVYRSPERNEDAGGSMLRVLKFYQRGYRIPLDSLASVITRLLRGVEDAGIEDYARTRNEARLGKILSGLLREVDPNVDPLHEAHLPSLAEEDAP